jgi:hypothetical protein
VVDDMSNEKRSKPGKWSAKYGNLVVGFSCLISTISSWGENWILTVLLGFGAFICGTIGIFDLKHNMND